MAKCVICGYEAKSLQPHLKHKHDMKVSEYYDKYNGAQVFDRNPGENFKNWAKENPEDAKRAQVNGAKASLEKVNEYLKINPEIRSEISRKGGYATNGKNLVSWREKVGKEAVSKYSALGGHNSSISKGHDYMARIALQNNRFCKYPYKSEKFNINKIFASSWEVNFIKLCETIDNITSLIHEPFGIDYETDKPHKYYPDFLVNNHIIIEIKPEAKTLDSDVIIKKIAAENFCKMNSEYSYIILTEKLLYSLRTGEITTSAQQELLKLLMI